MIRFQRADTGETLDVAVGRLLIAGFTGRDEAAVLAHVEELRELGAPAPRSIPLVVEVPTALLTTANAIEVDGSFTSGEVEPVLIVSGGERWLTVGSDHTDRDIERQSIAASKRVCAKVVSEMLLPLEDTALDEVHLSSWVDGEATPYQEGTMAEILPLARIETFLQKAGITLTDGDVLFLGTFPVSSGPLRSSRSFRAVLVHPGTGERAELAYRIEARSTMEDTLAEA